MTIKFQKIKELRVPNQVDAPWLTYHQAVYLRNPAALQKDYELLVKTLASLHVIEEALRTKVLHSSGNTLDVQGWVAEQLPVLAGSLLQTILKKI